MKKIFLLLAVELFFYGMAIAQPGRRLFDSEKRCGDTRPQPALTLNKASLRSGERMGEGSAKGGPVRQSPKEVVGWQPNGICICDTAAVGLPKICSDGNSGAIVCWTESYRSWPEDTTDKNSHIYSQRVDSGGNIVWQSQGVPVCSVKIANAGYPAMIADGYGGAIIAWEEYGRDGGAIRHVYAQRLDSLGNRLWTETGVLVCNQMSGYVALCSDGHGGAIITWVDDRNVGVTSDDIYAQRIDSAGNPAWAIDGVPVCTADSIQFWPYISSNGNYGAVITWAEDIRTGDNDVYSQILDKNGNNKWVANGLLLVGKTGDQAPSNPIINNYGGVIIGWTDYTNFKNYVQSLDSNGEKKWDTTGVELSFAGHLITDINGGVISVGANKTNRIDSTGNISWVGDVLLHNGYLAFRFDTNEDIFGGALQVWDDRRIDSN